MAAGRSPTIAGVKAAHMSVRMGADVEAAVTGKERLAGEALSADRWKTVGGELARLRAPRKQQVARLEEAVVGGHPQNAGFRVGFSGEFTATDAMLFHHLSGVDVDGEQDGALLAQFGAPEQVNVAHRIVGDPATLKATTDYGTTQSKCPWYL